MACPFLEYRTEGDGLSFDHERPFCDANGTFVSPMRADVCNDRFEFDHREDCEVYRKHVGSEGTLESETSPDSDGFIGSEGPLD